ncbi:MAG: tetratricopeptide repeat protein [Allomuricauda sp.]
MTTDTELITNAISQKNQGNYDGAEKFYNEAIALNGTSLHKAYYNKGVLLEILNRLEEAQDCYTKATSLKPDYGIAWNNLGDLLCRRHSYERAKVVFEKALTLMPNEFNPRIGLAYALNRLNDFNSSLNILKKLLEESTVQNLDNKSRSKIYSEMGLALMHTNNITMAQQHFTKAFELYGQDYQTCYNIAFIADVEKKYDVAIEFYDKAIALNPNEAKGHQGKACTLVHIGKYEEALDLIKKAIQLDSNNFEGYYNLACIYANLAKEKEMFDALEKTIDLAPPQINIGHHILNDPDFSNYRRKISLMINGE